MLGYTQAVIDRAIRSGGKETSCFTDSFGRNASEFFESLWTVFKEANKGFPLRKRLEITTRIYKITID